MKLLLGLSLLLNIVFGVLILRRLQHPVPERMIIETHPARPAPKQATALVQATQARASQRPKLPAKFHDISAIEIEEKVDRMKQDRRDFLLHDLMLTEDDLRRLQEIHREYDRQVQAIIPSLQGGELSLSKRRGLLDLEEKKENDIRNILGRSGWEKFQRFKQKYNRSQDGLVIPMEI